MAPLNKKESNYEPGFKLMARSPSDYVLRQRQHPQTREHSTWVLDTDTDHYVAGPFRSHAQAQHALIRAQQEIMVMPDIPGVEDLMASTPEGLIRPSINEILQTAMGDRIADPNPCGEINLEDIRPSGPRLSVADRETLRHRLPEGDHLEYVGVDYGNIERRILGRMQQDEAVARTDASLEEIAARNIESLYGDNMFTVTGRIMGHAGGGSSVNLRQNQPKASTPVWSIKGAQDNDGRSGRWFVLHNGQKFAGPFPTGNTATIVKEYLSNIMDNPHMAALEKKRAICLDNDEDKNLKSRISDLENTLAKVMDVVSSRGQITGKGKKGNKHKRLRVSFKLDHLEEVRRILKGKKSNEVHQKAGGDSSGRHADRRRRNVRVSDADRSASSSV